MDTSTNLLLERMFFVRRVTLRAGVVCLAVLCIASLEAALSILTEKGRLMLLGAPFLAATLVAAGGVLVTSYCVLRAGLREAGAGYAIGHSLLCLVLSSQFLLGVLLVPLMLRRDFERWQQDRAAATETE